MPSDMYVQIGDVKGEATDDAHKDWIEVFSWSFGATQPASPIASASGGGTTGKADVHDFSFTHPLDLSSAKLFELCCTGESVPKVDRKSTRLNSSHGYISYAVFCLKKKIH